MSALRKPIVLDSNLIVSAFLHPQGTASEGLQLALTHFDAVSSKDTLSELLDVLRRDKFDRYASADERILRLMAYSEATRKVPVTLDIQDCQDPKDNKFLALALTAQARVLVSGDKKHVLSMNPYRGVDIIGVRDFITHFKRYM